MEYLLTRTSFVSGGFGILVESMTSTFCMTSKLAFPYQTSMKWKIFKNLDIDFYVKWLGFVILDLESFTRNFYSGIIAIRVLNGCIINFISRMSVGPSFYLLELWNNLLKSKLAVPYQTSIENLKKFGHRLLCRVAWFSHP